MINLVQQYFSASAKKFPKKDAVVAGEQSISFSGLESQSNQLARALKERGVVRGDRVSFCLDKSLGSIGSVLAILKADGVYVPLGANFPRARVEQVVVDATPKVIICSNDTESLVEGLGEIFNLDKEDLSGFDNNEVEYENNGEDLAYILYTSGSTGKPKGVMITHNNLINATEWAVDELGITSVDRISQHPPLYFDLSTFDLYTAFKAGATLFLVDKSLSLFPGQLIKFIEKNELTIWNSVPSVMVNMFTSGLVGQERMPKLKQVFFNGEAFPTKFLIEWMKVYPNKKFINMYGPTEATVQSTFYVVPPGSLKDPKRLAPIGKPTANSEVFIVAEDGALGKPGDMGELYIGGEGVGKGYWNDEKRTKEVFVPHPFSAGGGVVYKTGDMARLLLDGNFEFVGRKDFQVKVMGNRIELGDIESALYSLPYVVGAGVVAVGSVVEGDVKIVAFVSLQAPTPQRGRGPDRSVGKDKNEGVIKEDLAKLVPSYMVPREIVIRSVLPKTSSGKIDRNRLKKLLE